MQGAIPGLRIAYTVKDLSSPACINKYRACGKVLQQRNVPGIIDAVPIGRKRVRDGDKRTVNFLNPDGVRGHATGTIGNGYRISSSCSNLEYRVGASVLPFISAEFARI